MHRCVLVVGTYDPLDERIIQQKRMTVRWGEMPWKKTEGKKGNVPVEWHELCPIHIYARDDVCFRFVERSLVSCARRQIVLLIAEWSLIGQVTFPLQFSRVILRLTVSCRKDRFFSRKCYYSCRCPSIHTFKVDLSVYLIFLRNSLRFKFGMKTFSFLFVSVMFNE